LKPDSLTIHTMAVKRASRLNEEKDKFQATDDTVVEDMIEMAREKAYSLGMRPYYLYRQKNIMANLENTGYARPGCECVYNIQTMEERQSIIAFGAGAVSKRVILDENRIERAFNVKEVSQYISRIDEMIQRKKAIFI
jgi:coproporphyrinogen III oxidase-like Fe-S oxidoreductase